MHTGNGTVNKPSPIKSAIRSLTHEKLSLNQSQRKCLQIQFPVKTTFRLQWTLLLRNLYKKLLGSTFRNLSI